MKTTFKYIVELIAISKYNKELDVLDSVSYKKIISSKTNPLDARKEALQIAEKWNRTFEEDDEFIADFFKPDVDAAKMPFSVKASIQKENSEEDLCILCSGDADDDLEIFQHLLKEHELLKQSGLNLKEHEQLIEYFDHKDKKNKKGYILPNGMNWEKPTVNILCGMDL